MEASGTGNMKFAMNGALTIGTLDGANIEIKEAVGDDNIFIFGLTAGQIAEFAQERNYQPTEYYEADPRIKRVLDELASDRFCPHEPGLFRWIRDVLLNRDTYFLLADFASYIETQSQISREYIQPAIWSRKTILNVARIGTFSSDRTVREYGREIWGVEPA
jgi:starch phosphorylase